MIPASQILRCAQDDSDTKQFLEISNILEITLTPFIFDVITSDDAPRQAPSVLGVEMLHHALSNVYQT
jgi:hypothetical protein